MYISLYAGCFMLSPADRDFFALVNEAAFANPFGEERERIDRRLARAPKEANRDEVVDRLLALVKARLHERSAATAPLSTPSSRSR
jgi:hypothetical protein